MVTISTDDALDILDDSPVAVQDVAEHRWYTTQLVVFANPDADGALWGFYHLTPATELQEGQDRFESDPVHIFPVNARTVTQTLYERTPEA